MADARNDRIQVFDLNGNFLRQWPVPQRDNYLWHYPDIAFGENTKRIYVTSGWTKEVLVFNDDGKYVESLKPAPPEGLNNASSIMLSKANNRKRLYVLNTGSDIVESGNASVAVFEPDEGAAKE